MRRGKVNVVDTILRRFMLTKRKTGLMLKIASQYVGLKSAENIETAYPMMVENVEISTKIRKTVSFFGIHSVQATQDGKFTFYDRQRFATSNPCRMGKWDESGFVIGIRNRDLPANQLCSSPSEQSCRLSDIRLPSKVV
jgi:hypothetical protein